MATFMFSLTATELPLYFKEKHLLAGPNFAFTRDIVLSVG
jgi:hypothetical protein